MRKRNRREAVNAPLRIHKQPGLRDVVREDAGDHSLEQDGKQSICMMSPQFTLHSCVRVSGTVNTTEKELVLFEVK